MRHVFMCFGLVWAILFVGICISHNGRIAKQQECRDRDGIIINARYSQLCLKSEMVIYKGN